MSATVTPATQVQFDPDQEFSRLNLQTFTSQLMSTLPTCPEDQVLRIRQGAKSLGSAAWKIEAACDAELCNRAKAKRGRGNVDIEGVGITAAVTRRARAIGCTPNTIFRNARMFKLLQEAEKTIGPDSNLGLEDKGYYDAALFAAQPVEALELFSARKKANPRFRPTDAFRLLESEQLTAKAVYSKATAIAREETGQLQARELLTAHIERTSKIIREQVIPDCPDSEFAARIYGSLMDEMSDYLADITDADTADALRRAWKAGSHSSEQLSTATGFPRDTVDRVMNCMKDDGEFHTKIVDGKSVWTQV